MAGVEPVPVDYDDDPERYRRGMRSARAHGLADLPSRVAEVLDGLGAASVLDVGAADGVLARALPASGPRLVGLDASATMLAAHPVPAVRADAGALPFRSGAFDAVVAMNVLYHLPDPVAALREARRVLRRGGHLVATAIARDDSPELAGHWSRPATTFDAEDAPALVGAVFDTVTVERWDAPLFTLPDAAAIREYLLGRGAPRTAANAAAAALPAPLTVTKRGALVVGATRV